MSEYSVGINVEDIIEAEDELDAMAKFFESLTGMFAIGYITGKHERR